MECIYTRVSIPVLHTDSYHLTMKTCVLVLLLAVAAQAAPLENDQDSMTSNVVIRKTDDERFPDLLPRIGGGNQAPRGRFPHQVAILIDNSSFCSGSLIHPRWVLTAAHCVKGHQSFQVTLGATDRAAHETSQEVIRSSFAVAHSRFNSSSLENDIALLQLSREARTSEFIKPVRLPQRWETSNLFVDESALASGWGQTVQGKPQLSNALNYVEMKVVTNKECGQAYKTEIARSTLCAAGDSGESTCLGDNGGPLTLKEFGADEEQDPMLIGVVSFLPSGGCSSGAPSGFTRVTSYLDWISANTGITIS